MKSLIRFIIFFTICLSSQKIFSQTPKKAIDDAMRTIDSFIETQMNESGMVGLGAALIVNKEVVWTKGYGYADKESQVPFTSATIMNIGSISKVFTGVAIMHAVEEKKVSLDADINTYLPFKIINPYFPDQKITLRTIATHTSGLADRYPFYDSTYYYGGDAIEPLGEFLQNYFVPGGKYYAKENFLNHKPGTYREYSNIAAGLAGYIVELTTGKRLNEYTRQYIFKPLKMNNTGWFLSEIKLQNHSKLYDKSGDTLKPIRLYGVVTYPDGGVRTSVSELSRFFIALLNEGQYKKARILSKESADEMLRFNYTSSSKPENVKLNEKNSGIFWSTKMNVSRIGHGGGDPGVRTEMLADLSKEVGVILFTNTELGEKKMEKYFYSIYNELHKAGVKINEARKALR